jgi:N4-gp56 family major capsid protein
MAEWSWEWDMPSGVGKNHALSDKMRQAAVAESKFMQFVTPEPNYGRRRGESINIPRVKAVAVPTSVTLSEGTRIPTDTFVVNYRAVTVDEIGRSVQFTHKSELLAHFDLKDKIQAELMRQLKLALDIKAATAFKAGQIIYIPTSVSAGTFDTDGAASTTALVNLTVAHLKTIRDYMSDSLHVPGYGGGDRYIVLASTKACRGLKNDPEFLEWNKFGNADKFFKGQVGMIENCDVIEVNHTSALSNTKGSGSILGEAVFFGDDAVTMAEAEACELRAAIPADYGREQGCAWYGVLAFLNVWGDSANDGEARTILVSSA